MESAKWPTVYVHYIISIIKNSLQTVDIMEFQKEFQNFAPSSSPFRRTLGAVFGAENHVGVDIN